MKHTRHFCQTAVYVCVIVSILLSGVLPSGVTAQSPETATTPTITVDSIQYGEAWSPQEFTPDAPVPLVSQTSQAEEIAQPVQLFAEADPAIYLPGKPIRLGWHIRGDAQLRAGAAVQARVHPAPGLEPTDPKQAKELAETGALLLPVSPDTLWMEWQALPKAEAPFQFTIYLLINGQSASSQVVDVIAGGKLVSLERASQVRGWNDKVSVDIQPEALDEPLLFEIRDPAQNKLPPLSLTGEPVEVIAVGQNSGRNVHSFKQPITLSVQYDPAKLWGGAEEDLLLFYYDEETRDWRPLPTRVDTQNRSLTAETDHLTVFDYKAATWQANSLPTVDGFQVSEFTGAAMYNINLWTPPGPVGLQPNLSLNYNSQVIDESSAYTQASWVGMGWSLETGAIVRNMHGTNSTTDDTFLLSLGGSSELLLPVETNGSIKTYNTARQSFRKIEYNTTSQTWSVWEPDGTKYEFNLQAKTHTTSGCKTSAGDLDLIWSWPLTKVTNIHNQSLNYTYTLELKNNCANVLAVYPESISYPSGLYRIQFTRTARMDYQQAWGDSGSKVLYAKQRLNEVLIQYRPDQNTAFSTVRKYQFTYATTEANQIYPKFTWKPTSTTTGKTLTLLSVQEIGTGTDAKPAVSFGYADHLHLGSVDNGQGGQVQIAYNYWKYFDDINDQARSLYTEFGVDECNPYGSNTTVWTGVVNPTYVRCDPSTHMLQVGQDPNMSIAKRSIPEHVAKPGARYRLYLYARALQGSTDANWGFYDTVTNASEMLYFNNIGTTLEGNEGSLDMPIDYNPSNTMLRLECDDCLVQKLQFSLYAMEYRVSSRTITDQVTEQTRTYSYKYDNASPNTSYISSAVASSAGGSYSDLYTPPQREFRGHAMVQATDPSGLTEVTWYHQGDSLKGSPARSLAMQRSFYSDMGSLDTSLWTYTTSGAHTISSILGKDFDYALKASNTSANWGVSTVRKTGTEFEGLKSGEAAVAHIRLSGSSAQADISLVNTTGTQSFGIRILRENNLLVARKRTNMGSGVVIDPEVLKNETGQDFLLQTDKWYVVMLYVDDDHGFKARIWRLDQPTQIAETTHAGFDANNRWVYRQQAYLGSLWLDGYFEGTIQSEAETRYTTEIQYDTSAGGAYPDLANTSLMGYKDLQVNWAYPSLVTRQLYDGGSAWYGTRSSTSYTTDVPDHQRYVTGQCVIETSKSDPGAATWGTLRVTLNEYHPLSVSGGQHLVNYPARQLVGSTPGTCNPQYGGQTWLDQVVFAETLYLYDEQDSYTVPPTSGLLTSRLRRVVTEPLQYSQETYSYDSGGNLSAETSYSEYTSPTVNGSSLVFTPPASGARTSQYEYDAPTATYLVRQTNPLGGQTLLSYDYSLGLPTSVTEPLMGETSAEYDSLGRMTSVTAPGDTSPTLLIGYYDYGSQPYHLALTQKLDSLRSTQVLRYYNGLGELIQSQTVGAELSGGTRNILVDRQYDGLGRLTVETTPRSYSGSAAFQTQNFSLPQTITEYDLWGRVVKTTDPGGNETSLAYAGRVVTHTNPLGQSTSTNYDVWGQVQSVTPPAGPSMAYDYDALGRLIWAYKGSGANLSEVHITYDLAGRKISLNDPDMGVWEYTYDAADNLLSQTDTCGSQTLLQYNTADQVTAKSFSAGTCGRIVPGGVSYSYNAAGQRTHRSDDSGDTFWSYDARGRVSAETRQWTLGVFQTDWSYNSADLLSGVAYPDDNQGGTGEVVSYAYKAQGALSTALGSDDYVTSTAYDEAGRLVSQGNATLNRSWSYYAWADPAGVGRTQGSSLSGQNGLNLLMLAYSYDALGGITSIQQGVAPDIQTQSFTYDSIQRLTSAQAVGGAGDYPLESYTYDDAGRLAQKDGETLTYAAGKHAALSKGSDTYSYDADGSLTQRVTAQGTYTYTYDVEGRLREARLDGVLQATYLYDGDGGMVQKVVGDTTTLYLGNIAEIELEPGAAFPDPRPCWPNCIDPPPDPTEIYMAPMMPGAPLPVWRYYYYFGTDRVAVRDNGDLSYMFGDHLGSTTVTANPNGTLQSQTRYKPWGEMRYSSGTLPTDYLYTGQRDAPEAGLYYYNARWYDPYLNRFLSPDSIIPDPTNPLDYDRYSYARNNPVKFTDPTGHWVETLLDLTFIAYDLAQINQEGWTPVNTVALAADIACAVLPVATGGGAAFRVIIAGAETTANAVVHVPEAVRVAQGAEKFLQFADNTNGTDFPQGQYSQPSLPGMEDYALKTGQDHHFLTNKNDYWTPVFKQIIDKYKLDLKGSWNIENIVGHIGRHTDEYWQWTYQQLLRIDKAAAGDPIKFLELFKKNIMEPVIKNPGLLSK